MEMDKEWILVILVPVLFAVGILAFFVFFPPELITLTTLVGYMSSLSTTIMVLVYIFTMSRQLGTMRSQLREMQHSRSVQIQPLPYLERPKAQLELPRYFTLPETSHKELSLMCFVHFSFSVSNIGNGPAISIDFLPFVAKQSFAGDTTMLVMETITQRIECLSLREGHSQDIEFDFCDDEHKVVESLLKEGRVIFGCTILYKNALGMTFAENTAFWAEVPSESDVEIVRSCMKVIKTAEIDFEGQVKEFKRMMDLGREEDAYHILDQVNAELKKRFAGKEEADLSVTEAIGSFELGPISQSEYEKALSIKRERARKDIEVIKKCWEIRGRRGPDKSE